jgi:hypothetical protein
MENAIHIGRSDTNHLIITYPRISGTHCVIKSIEKDKFLIEDMGSSNGTWVNGKRIRQCLIASNDEIKLADFKVSNEILFSLLSTHDRPKSLRYDELEQQFAIYHEFEKLHEIYNHYVKLKRNAIQGNSLVSTGIRAGLSLVPVVGSALGTIATGAMGNVQLKLMEIEEQYKKDYICPSCFNFLGAEPFENLAKRGFCSYCKTKWRP